MDLSTFHALLTPSGQEALEAATALSPREADFLTHFQALSRRFPPDLARAALETAILRREASVKFPFADILNLTRETLEQASSHEVSLYRAERYRQFPVLADLGCSIGGDTFALAAIAPTIGLDHDPLRLLMASNNLRALGLSPQTQLLQSNLTFPLPLNPGSAALFFDPARRSAHRRAFSVRQYLPPLSIVWNWLSDFPMIGVKISPGVDLAELTSFDAEVEFISLRGELKEAVLWFGSLRTAVRRATILPGPFSLSTTVQDPTLQKSPRLSHPKAFLYEPDPSIMRAGLVTTLAEMIDASQLDPDIAYLTAETILPTPYARIWNIEDWFPFQLKHLRAYLREHHIGRVTVKKRGSPLEPETLIRQLRLKGDQERVVVLTHLRSEPIVIICKGV